ncbi:MAG: stage V sporulation protein T [Clostridiaceae bacterium]|nr:stage V sporulation protein T [Clostridiaceae bacterium]
MKATGIVRRIDDLGRVVIPKEIRRTLRIREGDPLEIYTDREGEVILKKYSPIGELSDFAEAYAESLHNTSGHTIAVADRDSIIAVSGGSKKELLEKPLSPDVEKIIENRDMFIAPSIESQRIPVVSDEKGGTKYTSQVISPIISEGDAIGAVIMLSTDPKVKMGDVETKLVQSAANFLGRHMEQ